MSDYCKKCNKAISPSLIEMIEQMRDRLWELEETVKRNSKLKCSPSHPADPDFDEWSSYDKQLYETIIDKWNKLDDYYTTCDTKLAALCATMDRIGLYE